MAGSAFHQILCPIDMGPASIPALEWAKRVARQFGSHITLLYADWFELPAYFTDAQMAALQAEAVSQRRNFKNRLQEYGKQHLGSDIPFQVVVHEGWPVEVIDRYLREHAIDLIVMGSHGRTGVARWWLGSIAEHISHSASCPVLIVKESYKPATEQNTLQILCPVHQSPGALQAAQTAINLASAFAAHLYLLHAAEPGTAPQSSAQPSLCRWLGLPAGGASCNLSEITVTGHAAEQVLQFAEQHSVDLIVLSATHHPFRDTSDLGKTSLQIMRHSPRPVLLVPYKPQEMHSSQD